jgi:hypothetical protein
MEFSETWTIAARVFEWGLDCQLWKMPDDRDIDYRRRWDIDSFPEVDTSIGRAIRTEGAGNELEGSDLFNVI